MPFPWKIVFLLPLLSIACRDKKNNGHNDLSSFRILIDQANDEQQKLPPRLAAAQTAYALALLSGDKPAQLESIRTTGVLYLAMDSIDRAMASFVHLQKLADSVGDKENRGMGLNNIGLIFYERSVYDSAIIYYEQAGRLFRTLGDTLRIIQGDINTGIAYKNIGDYEKAFSLATSAARMMEGMPASAELGTVYNTLGNTLKDLNRPKEALTYHQKAIAIRRQLKDSIGIAASLNNTGNVYKGMKAYGQAIDHYLRALAIKNTMGSKRSRITTIDNIAEAYLGMQEYGLAAQYEAEALAGRSESEDKDGWMLSANRMAKIHMARHEPDKAKQLALRIDSLANAPIYISHQLKNALLLEEIYTAAKDYPNANRYAKKALELKDSLFNADMSAAISGMNARYNTEEQQQKIALAEKNDIIQEQEISQQRNFLLLMGCIIASLLVITYLLYVSNKLRKKARERTELLMAELNHRVKNSLQIISGILQLQTSVTENPQEIERIEAGRSRIQSISIVHNLLYQKEYTGSIQMDAFMTQITNNIGLAFQDQQAVIAELSIDPVALNADQAIPVGLIANELLINIYKYSQTSGEPLVVRIGMTLDKNTCRLMIRDNGQPWDMAAARRQRKGLGLLLVNMLIQQLKATWQSAREAGENVQLVSFTKA